MSGRDYNEAHRVATPLELFFDLVFVIAIASAASGLHHALLEHHLAWGVVTYLQVFFFIWWAWMNYTWFASAYDTDDVPYRLLTFLQMFGSIVFAIGVKRIFSENPDYLAVLVGYVIMRIAMASQWLRAASEDKANRKVCLRYAGGIIFAQLCWVLWYLYSTYVVPVPWLIYPLMLLEVSVPPFAEGKKLSTTWHPHHIAERYGLLGIIVLGEVLLGSANTIGAFLDSERNWWDIALPLGLGASGIVFALWWSYFQTPWANILHHNRNYRTGFVFGYAHYFIFASLAAVGSSLELVADVVKSLYLHDLEPSVHSVSPELAMVALSASLGVYFAASSAMKYSLAKKSRFVVLGLINTLIIVVAPISCVFLGLGIIYALFLTLAGIVLYMIFNQWEYQHEKK